jgi:hypothetical protein
MGEYVELVEGIFGFGKKKEDKYQAGRKKEPSKADAVIDKLYKPHFFDLAYRDKEDKGTHKAASHANRLVKKIAGEKHVDHVRNIVKDETAKAFKKHGIKHDLDDHNYDGHRTYVGHHEDKTAKAHEEAMGNVHKRLKAHFGE